MKDHYHELPTKQPYDIQRVTISEPFSPQTDEGIRLYSTMVGKAWALQIRGFFRTKNFKRGEKWYLANASLDVEAVRALRDACNEALSEAV